MWNGLDFSNEHTKMAVGDIHDAEDGEKLDNTYILFQFINLQHCYYDHYYFSAGLAYMAEVAPATGPAL